MTCSVPVSSICASVAPIPIFDASVYNRHDLVGSYKASVGG